MNRLECPVTNFPLIQIEVGVNLEEEGLVELFDNLLVGKGCLEKIFVLNVLFKHSNVLLVCQQGIIELFKIHIGLEDQVVQFGLVCLPVGGFVSVSLGFLNGNSELFDST